MLPVMAPTLKGRSHTKPISTCLLVAALAEGIRARAERDQIEHYRTGVVARVLGRFGLRDTYSRSVDSWVERTRVVSDHALVTKAIEALDRITSEPSELLELWSCGASLSMQTHGFQRFRTFALEWSADGQKRSSSKPHENQKVPISQR